MQQNPIHKLPQQFQALAQGLVENVLNVVRLFADVDPGTAQDEEVAARLYIEEVMVDVAQAMAHGREAAVPKILARVDARRARIRIRAKAESRKAMKSAILVGAGALADFLTHGLGSPVARGVLALQQIAAPSLDAEEEVEEFADLHPVPAPESPAGPGAEGDTGSENSPDATAGNGSETAMDDPENADSGAPETGAEDDKGDDSEGDSDAPEPTVGASTDEGPEGSEPGDPKTSTNPQAEV